MTFSLTDSLKDKILFAMEDQNSVYCVDAENGELKILSSENFSREELNGDDEIDIDEENYYSIPSWDSDDGFEIMENFTAGLHNPNAYKELRRCLANRRGVFRNFKSILKSYPEVEQKWYAFKDRTMHARITEWYNVLCESWGLEGLEENPESFDTEYLVQDDFEFTKYDSLKDKECVDREVINIAEEYKERHEGSLGEAVADIFKSQSAAVSWENKFGYACYSHDHEFLGCSLVSYCPSSAKKSVAFTDFFVIQNYRGLGIGKELLNRCLADFKDFGIQWVILSTKIMPESMENLFCEFSFKKTEFGFILNLQE